MEVVMKAYCKKCGSELNFEYGVTQTYCPGCKTSVQRVNTIADHTRNSRIRQLMAMHDLMCEANDEGIYMTWIYLMPDEPSEEDFEYIAIDDEQYNECFDLFVKLIAKNGNRY
jgi:predicted RNA-binding Zn-ribbon protein involved in translation (DUF1610 family)